MGAPGGKEDLGLPEILVDPSERIHPGRVLREDRTPVSLVQIGPRLSLSLRSG